MEKVVMLTIGLLCLCMTGCSAVAYFLSGCGGTEADLVVVNESAEEVWSIQLDYGNETQWVRSARERALLKPGESHGLELETGQVTVTFFGPGTRELVRTEVGFSGERLYLTLEEDGGLSISNRMEG